MAKAAQYLILLALLLFPLSSLLAQDDGEDYGSSGDEEDAGEYAAPESPAFPWEGESPYWVSGQEFSAVATAPFIGTAECLYCHTDKKIAFLKSDIHRLETEYQQVQMNVRTYFYLETYPGRLPEGGVTAGHPAQ